MKASSKLDNGLRNRWINYRSIDVLSDRQIVNSRQTDKIVKRQISGRQMDKLVDRWINQEVDG